MVFLDQIKKQPFLRPYHIFFSIFVYRNRSIWAIVSPLRGGFQHLQFFEVMSTRHSAVCVCSHVSPSSSLTTISSSLLGGSPSGHGPVSLASIIGSVPFTYPLCSRRMYVLKTNNNSLIRFLNKNKSQTKFIRDANEPFYKKLKQSF